MSLSIIIPALNEAENLAQTLAPLQAMRQRGVEVVLVDGGSADATKSIAAPLVDQVVPSAHGRARQMNAGAQHAKGSVLLFLHADSMAPDDADILIADAIARGAAWGRFDVHIHGQAHLLKVVAWMMNQRSRLSGIATGDQGLFMTRQAYAAVGGFPAQPLMEDIEICRRLKQVVSRRPACLSEKITTSGRRWEKHGVLRTILLMWQLRFRYWCGASPDDLYMAYYGK
ncbi:MAG: TIGR04283 family arsenosugar biosynthesis glycosyltransferase [Betaproteobacteria bacterium]|jgi:rSAM/selenodomain-associated transferase 2